MARRADHTREELTDLAVKVGRELIVKNGFSAFSARKVANGIGYTIGTIYNVFGSHDNLILAINAATLDDWYEKMRLHLQKEQGDKLMALAKFYLDYSRKNYNSWIALFEHHIAQSEDLPKWYAEKMAKLFMMVEEVLLPVVNGDEKKARQSAKVLWSGIHGIAVLSLSKKLDAVGSDSADILAEMLINNYIAGLKN